MMTLDDPRWTIVGHRGSPNVIKLAPLPQAAAPMRAAEARAVNIIKNIHHFKILRHALRAALGRARPAHRFSGPPSKVPDGAVPGVRGILAAGMSPSGGSTWRRPAAGCCWAARSCAFCEASSLKVWKNRSNFKECDRVNRAAFEGHMESNRLLRGYKHDRFCMPRVCVHPLMAGPGT